MKGLSYYFYGIIKIYRSPDSKQDNDNEVYKILSEIQVKYNIPTFMVGDFNFRNIKWYETGGYGASVRCCNISNNELRFISALHENGSTRCTANKTTWFR